MELTPRAGLARRRGGLGGGVGFGMFGISEPSAEFQDTIRFQIANSALSVALFGGLLLLASVRHARPGSWWDRHRGTRTNPG